MSRLRDVLWRRAPLLLQALMAGCPGPTVAPEVPADWRRQVEQWRLERERSLRAEDGWLTLVALAWFGDDPLTVGTGDDVDVRLAAGSAPVRVGTFRVVDHRVLFEAAPGVQATVDGRSVEQVVLHTDADEQPDVVRVGRVSIFAIDRDGRLALRIKDPEAPARRRFHGLDWYPVDVRWRVAARYEPFDEPREVTIPTATGYDSRMVAPGRLVFELGGRSLSLVAFSEHAGEDGFFVVFRDRTSGETTYGAGRYLQVDPPRDGATVLDFNRAYNPPCAFTSLATCPYPPPENHLPVAIEAGEKAWRGAHAP